MAITSNGLSNVRIKESLKENKILKNRRILEN